VSLQTVARRYALALVDVAIERGEQNEVRAEIEGWTELVESNPQLKEVFANPTIPSDQKRQVLEELISKTRVRETTGGFLRVLLKNQRLAQLKEISERYKLVLDERAGVVAADITTARPVPDNIKNALSDSLTAYTGQTVRLTFATDPAIIGGVVARIGSTIFDGSVQSQLERLAANLVGR
jgi:F-type H+-transporting ATPase subunit delta